MTKNIFRQTNENNYSVSTLDMASAVRKDRYTVMSEPQFSATSDFSNNAKFGRQRGGNNNNDDLRSITSVDHSELNKLFISGANKWGKPANNINGLVDQLNSISEKQMFTQQPSVGYNQTKQSMPMRGGVNPPFVDGDDSPEPSPDDNDYYYGTAEFIGGGKNAVLDSMSAFNKYISEKAKIKFNLTFKVGKYYREEAKKSNPDANVITLNDEGKKIFDKDVSSGKIESVVKKIFGQGASAARTTKSKKSNSKKTKKTRKMRRDVTSTSTSSKPFKQPNDSSEPSETSELSFVTTSSD